MSRRRSKNRERREANRRLPLSNSPFRSKSLIARSKPLSLGTLMLDRFTSSHESPRALKTALKSMTEQFRRNAPVYSPSSKPQKSTKYSQPNWSVVDSKKIEQPRNICEQRSIRKQVMFATNNAGRTGQKTPKWTELSKRKCK